MAIDQELGDVLERPGRSDNLAQPGAEEQQNETAEEDRIPLIQKIIYGCGGFANNTLAAAIGGMMIVLNLGLGMDPRLVGLLGALPRFVDALTDPLMGYISDNTRSRYGRRRPYIFVGAIAVGISFILLWQLPVGKTESFYFWYFLAGSLIFFVAYTVFATPWVALGYELTPDYYERTRLMGVQNFMSNIAYLVAPYFVAIMYWEIWGGDVMVGASRLAIIIGAIVIALGILPAIFLRERYVPPEIDDSEPKPTAGDVILNFFKAFIVTLSFKPFLKLCAATFLVFNGFQLIAAFQQYVIIFYVFGGDESQGSLFFGHAGSLQAGVGFAVIALAAYLGTKFGKRRAFFICTGVAAFGYAIKWFCYSPANPWLVLLPAPLMAFSLSSLFTLMPAMVADVVDADELNTGERREGMYGSIFWWVVKLGMSLALLGGGLLLSATGYDVALGGAQTEETIWLMRLFDAAIPCATSLLAIWAVASFSISEERAHEIRAELEARRGALGEAAA